MSEPVPTSSDGLRKALRLGITGFVVLMVASVAAWWTLDGMPGLYGALLGAAIGGFFVLTTVVVTVLTAHTNPQTTAAVLLGTWLVKVLVAIIVVASIQNMDFYSPTAFIVTVIVSLVVILGCETWGVLSTKAPYVEPEEAGDPPASQPEAQ